MNGLPKNFDPNATALIVYDCPGITALPELPNATVLRVDNCPGITVEEYQKSGGEMEDFLTGGGKTMKEIVSAGCWECHSWENCPTHVAYGVSSISQLPPERKKQGVKFIGLFDGKLLKCPVV